MNWKSLGKLGLFCFLASCLVSRLFQPAQADSCNRPVLIAKREFPSMKEPKRQPTVLPPTLGMSVPFREFGCQREFTLKGKTFEADSLHRQDAEGLRSAFQNVPESLELLDSYQETKRSVQKSAYLGTAGIVILLLGPYIADQWMKDDKGNLSSAGKTLKYGAFWGGATIAVGGFATSWITLQFNNRKLEKAIEKYREERPEDSLQFQFSTQLLF